MLTPLCSLHFATLVLLAALFAMGSAIPSKADIHVAYVAPKERVHKPIEQKLREGQALERVRDRLAAIKIPKDLTIKVEGCDGDINASYDSTERTIVICYEYLAYIQELAEDLPGLAKAEGLTPETYVVGPFLEVVLHEIAHAIFDLKKVPVLGREEDAADQVAAYTLLQLGVDEVRRTITSIAIMYASEAKQAPPKLNDFADEHGLPAQRLFNLLCISYGKDPKMFGDFVTRGFLPKERAEQCEAEYRQVDFAISRLIFQDLRPRP